MKTNRNSNPKDIIERLEILRETPERELHTAANGRADFLKNVESLPQPVSPERKLRLNFRSVQTKLQFRSLTIAIFLIVSVFGSGIVTASAAQSSLPGEQLYPVKILMEDIRLALAEDDHERLELHLEFAAERFEELDALDPQDQSELTDDFFADLDEHLFKAEQLTSSGEGDIEGNDQLDELYSDYEDLVDDEDHQEDAEPESEEEVDEGQSEGDLEEEDQDESEPALEDVDEDEADQTTEDTQESPSDPSPEPEDEEEDEDQAQDEKSEDDGSGEPEENNSGEPEETEEPEDND